ncbi:ATP-binding cassette domain-containing protein [Aquipuribacter sp. MA13-6]|uniref:ATP-binding cassette domain-containing protein n=1 Tax=unclassified Aquipuribacter TaxID=2635084 RepID=UPI003EEFACF2
MTLLVRDLVVTIHGVRVVDGVSFSVARGARTALVGSSGSGKSLTAAAVLGQLPVAADATGSVQVDGHEVLGRPAPLRPSTARPSMVLQDSATALNPLVRVGSQVAEPLRRRLGGPAARGAAVHLLAAVGLEPAEQLARRYPGELSGGQRQRVCLALALACPSPLLVADEPTTALDVCTQAGIVDLLRSRTGDQQGPSLLFITHDIAVATSLCDDVVVLHGGRVVRTGSVAELLASPGHPAAERLVAAAREADLAVAGLG